MTVSWVSCECLKLIGEVPNQYDLLNMSSRTRIVQNFGILYLHMHWVYMINIVIILIGPNCLGHAIGCDNVWAQYIWGQCFTPSSKKVHYSWGVFGPLEQENLGFPMILGVLMMMSR